MIEFQIHKRKSYSANKTANNFYSTLNGFTPTHRNINNQNQEVLQALLTSKIKGINFNNSNKDMQYSSKRSSRNLSTLRKTTVSFNKQKKQIIEDQYFRKTTMAFKTAVQKTSFFNKFLSDVSVMKNYNVLSHIGKGSFSIVLSAIQKQTNKQVAIKSYEKINALDWHRLENIKRQIRFMKKLNHQNIIALHHIIKQRNKLFIIMQNGGKQSLSGLLRKNKCFKQSQAKKYFKQILQGVKHFHEKGICHRDIKPQNILINQEGVVKIIDFGFSQNCHNIQNTFCGTPPFMCPQIVQKKPYNGAKADIWALGVMLYLMLVGRLPFRATSQQQLYRIIQQGKPNYDKSLMSQNAKRIIQKMLNINQQQRITAKDLLNEKWLR